MSGLRAVLTKGEEVEVKREPAVDAMGKREKMSKSGLRGHESYCRIMCDGKCSCGFGDPTGNVQASSTERRLGEPKPAERGNRPSDKR